MRLVPHQTISISISPNTTRKDVIKALKEILAPWRWKKGTGLDEIEKKLLSCYPGFSVFLFTSARASMIETMKSFGIGNNNTVIVQAFNCVAVPEAVIATGAKPIYSDIHVKTFSSSARQIEERITPVTKAVVSQHTFGIPADINSIYKLCIKNNLYLFIDSAHRLLPTIHKNDSDTKADAIFFSFGRDKVISSVSGGAVLIKNKHTKVLKKMKNRYKILKYPSYIFIFQQLCHIILMHPILYFYDFLNIGKCIVFVLRSLHIITIPVEKCELKGNIPTHLINKYPPVLARILQIQMENLEEMNNHRKKAGTKYGLKNNTVPFLRYPILTEKPLKILCELKRHSVLAGTWYSHIIDPAGVNLTSVYYKPCSCPNAENVSKKILNLPTNIRCPLNKIENIKQIVGIS
jgi:dTDP-4-amino-4,6-dideoxygalactose transaminase